MLYFDNYKTKQNLQKKLRKSKLDFKFHENLAFRPHENARRKPLYFQLHRAAQSILNGHTE